MEKDKIIKKKLFIVYLLFNFSFLYSERGIVTTCNNVYAKLLYANLKILRNELKCDLPVEIWHAGDELSIGMKKKLLSIFNVTIFDLAKKYSGSMIEYRGWHTKVYALIESRFTEAMLMDADLFLYKNPEVLFERGDYKKTGAFFFRDRRNFMIPGKVSLLQTSYNARVGTIEYYKNTRNFIRGLIKTPSKCLPADWRHYWQDSLPSLTAPITNHKMEAGLVLINKKIHQKALKDIFKLNKNRRETYKFIYGDKETYWIGMEMNQEPYSVNSEYATSIYTRPNQIRVHIVQFLDKEPFYQQKSPIAISKSEFYCNFDERYKEIPNEDRDMMNRFSRQYRQYLSELY